MNAVGTAVVSTLQKWNYKVVMLGTFLFQPGLKPELKLIQLLKIEDQGIEQSQDIVMTFFLDGTYNGQNILTEDNETYQQRLIDHWEKFGNIDL